MNFIGVSKAQGSDERPMADLSADRVEELLRARGLIWPLPVVVDVTGSTNADVEALARAGASEGTSVVADQQTAGRGRLDRTWESPRGGGLWVSVLLRPGDVPADRLPWLPLAAGLAVTDALLDACSVRAELKWPNDIVAIAAACGGSEGPRKLGGVLSIVVPGDEGMGVILGIGVNVNMGSADLPSPRATSVLLEGGRVDRGELLAALLQALAARVEQWRQGDPVLVTDYRTRCTTIGRHVDVELPGSAVLTGIVTGIDDGGHLLVSDGESTTTITAGDVIHATI
ncbi:MAG: biotin--[acetyl-CoA-carboxylase] ligase [Candidatus Nanopelagicales bacterium]|nr:biotin--[acetyl-CoA-carboxylase] ligase [Candidatus Nanopelagicales bacterium]MCF8536747.1 biotin--[acetyl-CoA-carboxylase] ligase [Candidatus Nanopelagicales bacterium]MCF8541935.1 biotin--[acetyl-CoA-carboxylase] ligase [Candidatus Nanopelagicales bacterium]MCF8556938.1 biotin--[acetyl-CoA-carboxylase] ligase [Candidatus Nanopelagicales bacterium]